MYIDIYIYINGLENGSNDFHENGYAGVLEQKVDLANYI